MKEYTPEDFDKCLFNPFKHKPKADLLEIFPELSKHEEFHAQINPLSINPVIRYIIACYDKSSPMQTDFDNLTKRKINAARYAGFTVKEGFFRPIVDTMLKGGNNNVIKMIIRYARLQGGNTYPAIIALREAYYDMLKQIMISSLGEGIDMKQANDKAVLAGKIKALKRDIESLEKEFLLEDNSTELTKALYQIIDEEQLRLTPESRSV